VSSAGGFLPRWRGDGRELFYLGPQGDLVSVGVTAGRGLELGDRRTLFALRVTPSIGMTQAAPFYGPDYDVSADGQRFLFNQGAESAQTSFVVLLGWQGALGL
jgi:eukaryotic-like serine/threonine-protein kinase